MEPLTEKQQRVFRFIEKRLQAATSLKDFLLECEVSYFKVALEKFATVKEALDVLETNFNRLKKVRQILKGES